MLCLRALATTPKLLVLLTMVTAMSLARGQTALPPVFPAVDGHGVDVATGNFNYAQTDVVIGQPGQGGLSYTQTWVGGLLTTNFAAGIGILNTTCTVVIGTLVETFTSSSTGCTGNITSDQEKGSTLVASGSGSYTYRTADGTTAVFVWESGNGASHVSSISRPNGEVTQFNYEIGTITCLPDPQHCYAVHYPERLTSITNNLGYMLVFEYPGTADQTVLPTRITGINAAVEFCGGSNCAQSWPYATYTYDTNGYVLTSTNAAGQTTTFSYTATSAGELLSKVQFPDQSTHNINVAFDANSRVHSVNLGFGSWSYLYADSNGNRTTTVTNPDGSFRSYVSSITKGTIGSITNELSRTIGYSYDAASRRTQVTLPEGNNTQYTYDSQGNITQVRRVAKPGSSLTDIVTSATFAGCLTPGCNQPTSTTDPLGYRTDYTYNTTHGGVTEIDSPAPSGAAPVGSGIRPAKRFTYAQFQARYMTAPGTWTTGSPVWRLIRTSVCATGQAPSCVGTSDETVSTTAYPGAGSPNNVLPSSSTVSAGNGSPSSTTAVTYTNWGDILTVDGPVGGPTDTTRYYYDSLRRQIGVVSASPDGTAVYRATKIAFNAIGQVSDVQGGTVTSQSDTAFSSFAKIAEQDTMYDAYARPLYARIWNGGSVAALTQFSYDIMGRSRCTTARMNPAVFASLPADACTQGAAGGDGPDRIDLKSYWPDGTVSSEQSGVGTADAQTTASYTYTANGLMQTLTDAQSNRTTYSYDSFDRLVQQNYPSPTSQNQSSLSDYEQRTFDAFGRLASQRRRSGESFGYSYDNAGRVVLRTAPGTEPSVSYNYDLLGRVVTQSQPGNVLSTTYDQLSRVLTQSSSVLGTVSYQYDSAGRRTRMTYPDGFYVTYGYNSVGDLTGEFEQGATQILGLTYDGLGRRATLTRGNGVTTSYTYDGASRLATLAHALSNPTYNNTMTFSYNAAGQLDARSSASAAFSSAAPLSTSSTYAANGLNEYSSATGFTPTYSDGRGNLTGDGTRTYSYDPDNRLTSASGGVTLAYDPASRLASVAGSAGTTQFLYDGNDVIAEYDGSATPVLLRRYVHGPGQDEPLVWYEGTGTTNRQWLLADERGSVIAMTDGSGAVTQVDKYNVDGGPDSGNSGRFQFTGQMWIPELSLYSFKARLYHPGLGRFMQTDPAGFAGGLNLYAYAGGDPVNMIDPSGACSQITDMNDNPLTPWDCGGGTHGCSGMWDEEGNVLFQPSCTGVNQPSSPPDYLHWLLVPVQPVTLPPFTPPAVVINDGDPPQKESPTTCTAAQHAAAQLAHDFDHVSTATGWLAFGSGLGTALAGAGEGITFGTDTPVTVSFGAATGFFGTASFITGAGASALSSFARGDLTAMRNFNGAQVTNLLASAAARKVPGLERWAETLGDLAEKAHDLATQEEALCHHP
jgi:RHS repeat-associated protein